MRTRTLKEMTCDAQVVGVAGYTPPARGEQLGSLLSYHIVELYIITKVSTYSEWRLLLQTRTLGITSVPELILFVVRCSENVIS
jgi:hypothetical protein